MALQTGQIIDGKYRIIRELGSGSMGAVYEGEHLTVRRRVAIKVLLPALAQQGNTVRRFEHEAQAAGRIGSEHIVEVLDLGVMADGGFYMVMEFLEGMTLRQRLRVRGRLQPREISPIAQQLLMGLEMAHQAGIIHRDLKPDNVFLMREHAGLPDFVKILDFGVSKFNPLNAEDGMSMTRTGTVVGTPFYMAPEQAKGSRDVDGRSDLYSVGVILYQAVTGQVPFHAGTFNELIFKIVLETPPPPETYVPDLDPAFSRIIRRAMARDPQQRFGAAAEFRETLSMWLHTGRDEAPQAIVPPPPASTPLDWDDDQPTLITSPDDGAATLVVEPLSPLAVAGSGAHRAKAKAPPRRKRPQAAPSAAAAPPNAAAASARGSPQLGSPTPSPEPPVLLPPGASSAQAPTPPDGVRRTARPMVGPSGTSRRSSRMTALIAGAVVLVGGGCVAAVLLLGEQGPGGADRGRAAADQPAATPTPPASNTAAESDDEAAEIAAATTSADADEGDATDDDLPTEATAQPNAQPVAVRPAHRPATPRRTHHRAPPAQPQATATSRPTAPSKPPPSTTGSKKPTGRQIKTEL